MPLAEARGRELGSLLRRDHRRELLQPGPLDRRQALGTEHDPAGGFIDVGKRPEGGVGHIESAADVFEGVAGEVT